MSTAELDAAGIADPLLRRAYSRCRALNAEHGRTYFLATRMLAPAQRPAVHALYGFARWADDIVDGPSDQEVGGEHHVDRDQASARLDDLTTELETGFAHGFSEHPVLAALLHTARRYQIDHALFREFLRSMRMDLAVRDYPNRAALNDYMRGSAEVIGLQMLPVLGTAGPQAPAAPHAAALGKAFQLTNFLRDVAEDLDRGRIYLPGDELASHNVHRDLLDWCRQHRKTDPRVRAALIDQHTQVREIYRYARQGIAMLHPVSRPCIEIATRLYAEILDGIERMDFAVFARRATVSKARRVRVAATALPRALWARRGRRADGVGRPPKDRTRHPDTHRAAASNETAPRREDS